MKEKNYKNIFENISYIASSIGYYDAIANGMCPRSHTDQCIVSENVALELVSVLMNFVCGSYDEQNKDSEDFEYFEIQKQIVRLSLGYIYQLGIYIKKDNNAALDWYQSAVTSFEDVDEDHYRDACTLIGNIHLQQLKESKTNIVT